VPLRAAQALGNPDPLHAALQSRGQNLVDKVRWLLRDNTAERLVDLAEALHQYDVAKKRARLRHGG
jgi:predicted ArsR family transcriptional regulator